MSKKYWLAALFSLALVLPLFLARASLAAPNFMGNWTGTAPKITISGCSNESVALSVTTQCTNLFSGTVMVGTTSVPMVGKFDPLDNTILINGYYFDSTAPSYAMVTISGIYVTGVTPSMTVISFSFSTLDISSLEVEYDSFSLIKQ